MEAIDSLNEKEKLVITLYYYENLKLKEIAEIRNYGIESVTDTFRIHHQNEAPFENY